MMSDLWRIVHIVQEVGFEQNQPYLRIAAFFKKLVWPLAPPRNFRPIFRSEGRYGRKNFRPGAGPTMISTIVGSAPGGKKNFAQGAARGQPARGENRGETCGAGA